MPRKVRTPATTVQNRINQRLSRARRKEYLEDLQRRLREYESHGAEVNAEIQRAARSVAVENEHLRALLALRGVSRQEVDEYLSSASFTRDLYESNLSIVRKNAASRFGRDAQRTMTTQISLADKNGAVIPQAPFAPPSPKYSTSPSLSNLPSKSFSPDDTIICSTPPEDHPVMKAGEPHVVGPPREAPYESQQTPELDIRGSGCTSALYDDELSQDTMRSILPPRLDCYCPAESPASTIFTQNLSSGMSCETAAIILAGLRGHTDPIRARSALGCVGTSDCLVKTTKLFQMMDEIS